MTSAKPSTAASRLVSDGLTGRRRVLPACGIFRALSEFCVCVCVCTYENELHLRIPYVGKIPFKSEGNIKPFLDRQSLKELSIS